MQLARYLTIVGQHYPDYRVIPLFLTREGQMPSDERFVPVSYRLVVSLLDDMMASRAATLGDDVRTLVRHYIQMVRRHIVNENEVVELCRRIYAKHQRALDLIYAHRPDRQVLKPAFAASYTVNQVFTRTWVTAKQLQEADLPELAEALRKAWQHFVAHELAEIEKIVRGERWIWPVAGETPDE